MKPAIHIHTATADHLDAITRFCAETPGPGRAVDNLDRLAEHETLLQVHVQGRLAGVAGLDLVRQTAVGPWARPADGDLPSRLLEATERLAASYGMTHLVVQPADGARAFFADRGYWKVAAGFGDGPPGMARSIIRRSTRFSRRVRAISADLGIPADYGARHQLRLQPEARRLYPIGKDIYGREQKLVRRASFAWKRMVSAAQAADVEIQPVSAFRTVDYQAELIRRKLAKGQTLEAILEVSAAPGFSEHHSGRAIDVTTPGCEVLEEPFEGTTAFAWLEANAGRFGFSLSYPRGNRHGVAYEPWHWCFRA